jgi:hypothetical protein
MAIYHLSAKVIKRSKGQSAVACAAYRAGGVLHDERTGERYDYTRKSGIDDSYILAPENAPAWVYNRNELWNAVEKSEKRKDAQLAREIDIALPIELNRQQQKDLVDRFVKKNFVDKGMVADIAYHKLDSHNPHIHIMLTMRNIGVGGFGSKNRDWNKTELLEQWRESWATEANLAFKEAKKYRHISHLSNTERGIERVPTIHVGVVANAIETKGGKSERGEVNRAIKELNKQLHQTLQDIVALPPEPEQPKHIDILANSALYKKQATHSEEIKTQPSFDEVMAMKVAREEARAEAERKAKLQAEMGRMQRDLVQACRDGGVLVLSSRVYLHEAEEYKEQVEQNLSDQMSIDLELMRNETVQEAKRRMIDLENRYRDNIARIKELKSKRPDDSGLLVKLGFDKHKDERDSIDRAIHSYERKNQELNEVWKSANNVVQAAVKAVKDRFERALTMIKDICSKLTTEMIELSKSKMEKDKRESAEREQARKAELSRSKVATRQVQPKPVQQPQPKTFREQMLEKGRGLREEDYKLFVKHIDVGWELLKHLPVEARKEVMKTFEENMLKNIQGDRFVIQQEMVHKPVKIEQENEKGFDISW